MAHYSEANIVEVKEWFTKMREEKEFEDVSDERIWAAVWEGYSNWQGKKAWEEGGILH